MEINIPICVRRTKDANTGGFKHRCQPLFNYGSVFQTEGEDLGKAIRRLTDQIRKQLIAETNLMNQSNIATWDVAESIETQSISLELVLSDRTLRTKQLLVSVQCDDVSRVFSPLVSDVWFDVRSDETIPDRATEVYAAYFNQCIKDGRNDELHRASVPDAVWMDSITVSLDTKVVPKKPVDPFLAFLGGRSTGDGASELSKVGRCLDWTDLESLAEPFSLEVEVNKVLERWSASDRRGLVLVGPPGCGKTAVIEGAVRQRRLAELGKDRKNGHVWQLSPARLISGMSYLGQWQSRLLAIWKHASRRDLVLYFDDMLGLFHAGVTRDSQTSAADLIRAQWEVKPVRLITEMTPQAWAIFRERDRAFAQGFDVLPMEGKSRDESLSILLGTISRLESTHRCRFGQDVLPEVLGLYDRFERSSVLPGKAIAALQRLAITNGRKAIDRKSVQDEFSGRTGLSKRIIDAESRLTRKEIVDSIGRHVFGQNEPIHRIADRILAASARVNDPTRPVGVFLLLGPTGVGKTELAKTISNYLYGEGGLIRIDMNELSSGDAAARLVGTFGSPDGILTVAARRRPHAVLLLDEIEKAAPPVLDTLLQVIGEARLTDARGRTVDLSGMMILMTSNLGASHSTRSTVLNDHATPRSDVYRRAAKDFFRPEFLNRIDGLLEFDSLEMEVVADVAQRQLDEVLSRDGLSRRMMVIDIEHSALRRVIANGFDPRLGARAVKRQVERELVNPIARVLVESSTEDILLVEAKSLDDKVSFSAKSIPVIPTNDTNSLSSEPEVICQRASQLLESIEGWIPRQRISLSVSGEAIAPTLLHQIALQDRFLSCHDAIGRLVEYLDDRSKRNPIALHVKPGRAGQMLRLNATHRTFLLAMQSANDLYQFVREMTTSKPLNELQAAANALSREMHGLFLFIEGINFGSTCHVSIESYGDFVPPDPDTEVKKANAGENDPKHRTRSQSLQNTLLMVANFISCNDNPFPSLGEIGKSPLTPLRLTDPASIGACLPLVGGWLRVDPTRRVSYSQFRILPEQESTNKSDSEMARNQDLLPVRWMLMSDHGIDLQSGIVCYDKDPASLIYRLIEEAVPPLPDQLNLAPLLG